MNTIVDYGIRHGSMSGYYDCYYAGETIMENTTGLEALKFVIQINEDSKVVLGDVVLFSYN